MDAGAILTSFNSFSNINLVSILTSITIDKGLGWGVKKVCEYFKKSEYNKYKNALNAPFFLAFKNTLNIFFDEHSSPCPLPIELKERLSLLNDIDISTIFSSPQNIDIPYDENNIYALMTEKFRTYNKIQGVELSEDFYMFWQTTFKGEYESAFALFLAEDNSILAQTIIKIFSISMGEINNIKSQLSTIKIDTTNLLYKQEILNQKMDLLPLYVVDKVKDELPGLLNSALQAQENPNEDKELKKIQKLFDDCDYENCISYIKLNKDDNWIHKNNAFHANCFNKLGACYLELNKPELAKEYFLTSIDTDPTYDNPKFNLAQLSLSDEDYDKFEYYLSTFNDKNSELYHKLALQKLVDINQDFAYARTYLEENFKNYKDYLFYKAYIDLKDPQIIDTINAETCLDGYIKQSQENTVIARFNLLNSKFHRLSNNIDWQFAFDLNVSGELKVVSSPVVVPNEEFACLLVELKSLYSDMLKTKKQQIKLLTNIQVKIHLTEYILGQFNIKDQEIENINIVATENKLEEVLLLEILALNILCSKYFEAHNIYKLLSDETKTNSRNNYILILFGEKLYEELIDFVIDEDLQYEINEQLKIVSLYKIKEFSEVSSYMRHRLQTYSDNLRLFCAWLYHDKLYYDDELKILKELTNKIKENPEIYEPNFVYKISYALAFFKTDNEIANLREQLIVVYWTTFPIKENFQMGIIYATDLFNKRKISQCLSILDILGRFEPENNDLKNLYSHIDLLNHNPQTLIENYEKGLLEETQHPLVAQSYIQTKEYEKAEQLINSFKYISTLKLQYYYLKFNLDKARNVDGEIIIEHLKEALEEFPKDLQLAQIIFGFLIHSAVVNEETRILFSKSKTIMQANNLIYEFQLDMANPIQSLTDTVEKFEPYQLYQKREDTYAECLDYYNQFKFPLTLIAEIFKITPGELFANFAEDETQQICFSKRSNEQYEKDLELITKNKSIIVNIQTLILIKILEIDELIFSNFKIKITNNSKLEIETIFNDITKTTTEKLVRDEAGIPHLIFVENNIIKYKNYLKSCADKLECVSFKSEKAQAIPLITAEENLGSKKLLFDSIVAIQNECLLCSSDAVMGILNKEFNGNDISLLSMLRYLVKHNIITSKKESLLKFKLINLGCKYIPLTAEDLTHILTDKIDNFKKIKTYLNKEFEPSSVANVLAVLILNIDNNPSFNENKFSFINEMFEWFNSFNEEEPIKLLMSSFIEIYSELSTLTQKCISQNFSMYVLDETYTEKYYKTVARKIVLIRYNNLQKCKEELLRLFFNVSPNIQNKLKLFIDNFINLVFFDFFE